MSMLSEYRIVVVGTDGSALAGPTVARAALQARREDADLVIVCAFAEMARRAEAKNVATLGGDSRLGRSSAATRRAPRSRALSLSRRNRAQPSLPPCWSTANPRRL